MRVYTYHKLTIACTLGRIYFELSTFGICLILYPLDFNILCMFVCLLASSLARVFVRSFVCLFVFYKLGRGSFSEPTERGQCLL